LVARGVPGRTFRATFGSQRGSRRCPDAPILPGNRCKVPSKVDPLYQPGMIMLRLTCSVVWVDVRLREINGRWIASADTRDGPSLGLGLEAREAIEQALKPFEGIVDDLLASLPGGS